MIGSAGEVCCQIVKQIIPIMSLFVQREHVHLSSAHCMTDTILISNKGEAFFSLEIIGIIHIVAITPDSPVPVNLIMKIFWFVQIVSYLSLEAINEVKPFGGWEEAVLSHPWCRNLSEQQVWLRKRYRFDSGVMESIQHLPGLCLV